MKVFLGLLLLVGVGAGAFYYTGAFEFNPAQQAKDIKAKIKPGMSYDKVVAVSKPRKYCIHVKKKQHGIGGAAIETCAPGPEVPFDENAIKDRVDRGGLECGFSFSYNFSQTDSFGVMFDQYGDVVEVYDNNVVKKLFDM